MTASLIYALQAFRKEEQPTPSEDGKRNYVWVLEQAAIDAGFVESTTRYRRPGVHKKPLGMDSPLPKQRTRSRNGYNPKNRASRQHKRNLGRSFNMNNLHGEDKAYGADQNVRLGQVQLSLPPYSATRAMHHVSSALPSSPDAIQPILLNDYSYHSLPETSSHTQEQSFAQHYSPTPTMTTGSNTDQDTYEFDQVMGCSEASIDEPLFYNAPNFDPQDTHNDLPMAYKGFISPHHMQSLDPLLTDLPNPSSS